MALPMLTWPTGADVHIWPVVPEAVSEPGVLRQLRNSLADDERAAVDRFLRPEDRHRALVSKAWVRRALSRYVAVEPRAWRFTQGPWGRPEIAEPAAARGLRFSLSHTAGLTLVAVRQADDVGVDVEAVVPLKDRSDLARRFFAAEEVSWLESQVTSEAREAGFYTLWTLKEAYIKATGRGMSTPLDRFHLTIGQQGTATIGFHPPLDRDDARAWSFSWWRPTPATFAAVALRGPAGRAIRLRVFADGV